MVTKLTTINADAASPNKTINDKTSDSYKLILMPVLLWKDRNPPEEIAYTYLFHTKYQKVIDFIIKRKLDN